MENKKTLNEIIEEWLNSKKDKLKESTYYRYSYMLNQYIIPYFNNIEMKKLEKYDFKIFIEELKKSLNTRSIENVITLLKSILTYTKKKYGYNFDSDSVSLPRSRKEKNSVLSQEEKNRLEKYCLNKKTLKNIGIIVCLNTGLRIGEICALKWNCINLEERTIEVKYTMQRIYDKVEKKSKVIMNEIKNGNALRTIPISTKLYNILKPLKRKYPNESYFLTCLSNKYIEPRNYQKMLKECLNICKIEDCSFNKLRNSFANNCINLGMDIKAASEVLGYSSVSNTLEQYTHTSIDIKRKYLEKL